MLSIFPGRCLFQLSNLLPIDFWTLRYTHWLDWNCLQQATTSFLFLAKLIMFRNESTSCSTTVLTLPMCFDQSNCVRFQISLNLNIARVCNFDLHFNQKIEVDATRSYYYSPDCLVYYSRTLFVTIVESSAKLFLNTAILPLNQLKLSFLKKNIWFISRQSITHFLFLSWPCSETKSATL